MMMSAAAARQESATLRLGGDADCESCDGDCREGVMPSRQVTGVQFITVHKCSLGAGSDSEYRTTSMVS
jgi:hypothetical protein